MAPPSTNNKPLQPHGQTPPRRFAPSDQLLFFTGGVGRLCSCLPQALICVNGTPHPVHNYYASTNITPACLLGSACDCANDHWHRQQHIVFAAHGMVGRARPILIGDRASMPVDDTIIDARQGRGAGLSIKVSIDADRDQGGPSSNGMTTGGRQYAWPSSGNLLQPGPAHSFTMQRWLDDRNDMAAYLRHRGEQ
ncbi:hypothetical protein B0A48_16274 [Cryoendolithus antarcticus]|uniref:Uncharacterized protein n=1 Tax=Cryoendolithus antarcticus TaxID=1507870 RepID=A0A1V8SFW0_9PEZI|nr:hypothetical protein B0A48_16274 [Cryoendolithus antarcticus]